jgi:hypothetical protein
MAKDKLPAAPKPEKKPAPSKPAKTADDTHLEP